MTILLYKSYFINFKVNKNFFISISINHLTYNKLFFFLLFKKKYFVYLFYTKAFNFFLTTLFKQILNFFKGFCFCLILEGKRFKFFINNFFIFFKMDTSHFKSLNFKNNFYLKKFKKNKLLFFYSFDLKHIKYNLLRIQFFKKPTKYKKKGLFLKLLI